jgi:nucleoside-diphosphate-sugar epimerase
LQRDVLVTGGTGYIGSRLVTNLLSRGHRVGVLTRAGSASRVVAGATATIANVSTKLRSLKRCIPATRSFTS